MTDVLASKHKYINKATHKPRQNINTGADVQVRECLLALPQKKWVFTNCNEKHAHLALQTLQIDVSLCFCIPKLDMASMH